MRFNHQRKIWLLQLLLIMLGVYLFLGLHSVMAQLPQPQAMALKVYELMPSIPKENNYISQETGKVDENNTLLSRLISYHIYVKGRPTEYRFDWQLTLADYLGVNQSIAEERYPGRTTLVENPLNSDRVAIDSLTRAQRRELVNVLVSLYNQQQSSSSSPTQTTPQTPPTPPPPPVNTPQPGDAELLQL